LGLWREIGLVVLGAVLGSVIPNTSQSWIALFKNIFTVQSLPVDYLSAIVGIGAIIGLTLIIYHFIQKLRDRKKKMKVTVEDNQNTQIPEKSPNEKFDDLLEEMETFVNEWRYSIGFIAGYRRQIEINTLGGDKKSIKKIIQHSSNIYTKINLVKKLGVTTINNKLDEMMPSVDSLVGLGEDIREFYWSSRKSKTILSTDKDKLLSNGDNICGQFDRAVYELRLLRKHLPPK
jgi:hypothetical protein